jgi:hypothetical protein
MEIAQVRYAIVSLRSELASVSRALSLRRKAGFNLDQPRVPVGVSDGGQWRGDGTSTFAKFSAPHSSSQLPARVITRDALICVILFWKDFSFPAVTEIHGIFKSA